MARTSYFEVVDHSTDAGFRIWGKKLSDALAAVGLERVDTNINWSTVIRNVSSTGEAGWEVYRFTDPLQAQAPVFLRVGYVNNTSSTWPGITIHAGTVYSGAGALSSQNRFVNMVATVKAAPQPAGATTYVGFKDGNFTLVWQHSLGGAAAATCSMVVARSCDAIGNPTPNAVVAAGTTNLFTAQWSGGWWSYDAAKGAWVAAGSLGLSSLTPPADLPNSAVGPVVNLFNWHVFSPDVYNVIGVCSYRHAEMAAGSQFDAALVGGRARHYLAVGTPSASHTSVMGSALDSAAVMWEE